MRFRQLVTLTLLGITQLATAQNRQDFKGCAFLKNGLSAKTTVASAAEDNYDVKYLKFNLNITNQSIAISGDVTTMAMTTAPSFSEYVFELNYALTIDSVLINGA